MASGRIPIIVLVAIILSGCTSPTIPVPVGGEAPPLPPYEQTEAKQLEAEHAAMAIWGADCVLESSRLLTNKSRPYQSGNREQKAAWGDGDREELDGPYEPSNDTPIMNVGDEDWVRMTFMADNNNAAHVKKIALVLRYESNNPDLAQLQFTGGETVYTGPFEGNVPVQLEAKVQAISEGYENTQDLVYAKFYLGTFGQDDYICDSIPYYINHE